MDAQRSGFRDVDRIFFRYLNRWLLLIVDLVERNADKFTRISRRYPWHWYSEIINKAPV